MKGKNVKRIVIAVALLAVLAISGIYAYFTDGDTASNIFTVGNIDIEITEQSWNPLNENYMTPKQELPKNPQIINYGENDAYVFMEVVTPYANVETANEDGTKNAAADTELFNYVINTDDGWVQVGHTEKNIAANTITRRYAYAAGDAMTVLKASETEDKNATPALFDTIKLANIIEGQGLTGTSQDIVVNAYAIQTDNINDGNTTNLDGNNNDGKTAPADVWEVLFNQRLVDYKPLECIQSSGTQYIDTGVQGGNIKYSADIVFDSIGSGWVSVLSEEEPQAPYNQAGPRIKDGIWASSGSVGSVNAKAGTRYYLEGSTEAENTYLDVNGARVVSNTNTTFAPYTLTIFGNNNGTTVGQRSSIKLYGLTLSDLDGRLIRNFVPCELLQDLPESKCADASLPHTEGTIGLWDTVEDKFYTNKGKGSFASVGYVLDDYVHDSAKLILDGIWNNGEGVHSDTLAAGWVDLSGNCQPTLLGTANTVGTNCITSNGTDRGKMTVRDVTPIDLTEFTLEVIYKRGSNYQKNQVILGRNHTSSYYVNTADNRLTVWIGRQTQDVATGTDYTKTYTLQLTCTGNSATAWVDGVKTKENFLANAKKANDKLMLFGNPENSYRFIGSIMAVRIHNRVLSDEELAQNYEIDKKRFGL